MPSIPSLVADASDPRDASPAKPSLRTLTSIFLVVAPAFMGYAAFFSLQRRVKLTFKDHDRSDFGSVFELACSFLYIGNLVLRMGHNILFAWLRPQYRVCLAQLSICLGMLGLASLTYTNTNGIHSYNTVAVVFISYFLGGVGVGTFEANLLHSIKPLGHRAKLWAIAGMPSGIVVITVGGFGYLQITDNLVAPIYMFVFACTLLSVILFLKTVHISSEFDAPKSAMSAFKHAWPMWRQWLPQLAWHAPAMTLNMFCVACSIPLALYIFPGTGKQELVTLNPAQVSLPHNLFLLIFDACFSLGDFISRQVGYPRANPMPEYVHSGLTPRNSFSVTFCQCGGNEVIVPATPKAHHFWCKLSKSRREQCTDCQPLLDHPSAMIYGNHCEFCGLPLPMRPKSGYRWMAPHHPWWFLVFSCVGMALILCRQALFAPIGAFLIAFGNGALYAQTCYQIDDRIHSEFNLTALSFWLFVGDAGSVIGTNFIKPLTS